jgi:hypothetical protein
VIDEYLSNRCYWCTLLILHKSKRQCKVVFLSRRATDANNHLLFDTQWIARDLTRLTPTCKALDPSMAIRSQALNLYFLPLTVGLA